MNWTAPTLWWLAAGALLAVEMASGTFYLLMLSLGCAAAAIAGHLGAGPAAQIATAAVVGIGCTVGWHLRRAGAAQPASAEADRNVNLDIGSSVHVDAWSLDGSAQVRHRGAAWAAHYAGSGAPQPGEYVIVAVEGSRLSLAPRS